MANPLTKENKVLLNLLAKSMFGADVEIDCKDIDFEKLFLESVSQTVLAQAFDALPLEVRRYNPQVYDTWQEYAYFVVRSNSKQLYLNIKLDSDFKNGGLKMCTIKGFAAAYYYDKKHLRQMGDIDFLVPAEDMEKSRLFLLDNGYEQRPRDESEHFHIGFTKNKEKYEMHKGITYIKDENGQIDKYMAQIFDNCISVDFEHGEITIPGIFEHGLTMLLHMQRHMLEGGIGLRHLCDWAAFVNSVDNGTWVDTFEQKLKGVRLWRLAQALGKVASIYLKMPEKDWFAEIEPELAQELLVDILLGGNFGLKNIKRAQESFFISVAHKSKLRAYVSAYIRMAMAWRPFYKKHKWLLPVGIVAYTLRTSFLLLIGKRRINLVQTHKNGAARDKLYKNLFS